MDTETLHQILSIPVVLGKMRSYADALTAAIRRKGDIEIDGLKFMHVGNEPTDHVNNGRHTMIYRLADTARTYRIMIEPVRETHGGQP